MSDLPPEQWRSLFDKVNVEFGYRPLATRIGMDHTRLRRLLLGGGTTAEAISLVADAFGVRPDEIRALRGEQAMVWEPFTLPDEAGRLNHDEREVVRSVINAILKARDDSAAKSDASGEAGKVEKTDDSGDDAESLSRLRSALHGVAVEEPQKRNDEGA